MTGCSLSLIISKKLVIFLYFNCYLNNGGGGGGGIVLGLKA